MDNTKSLNIDNVLIVPLSGGCEHAPDCLLCPFPDCIKHPETCYNAIMIERSKGKCDRVIQQEFGLTKWHFGYVLTVGGRLTK